MNDQSSNRVVVFAAHPDDPEFACSGTIAKWVAEGAEVRYVLCTSGDKGSWDAQVSPGEMATVREREQIAAARTLGVVECIFLRHVDGELEPTLAFRREVTLLLRQFRPRVVVTHDPWLHYQIHPDHRAVGFAVIDAVAAARDIWYYPDQLIGDVTPHRVKEIFLMRPQEPNFWVDISDTIEKKIAALRCHASQTDRIPNLSERIHNMARTFGQEGNLPLAEAFRRWEIT